MTCATRSVSALARYWISKPLGIQHIVVGSEASITVPAHDYARQWLGGRVQKPLAELREVFAEAAWRVLRPD
jgi:hypothetical protein